MKTPPAQVCGPLEAIGNTPLVELRRLRPQGGARVPAKLEGHNPDVLIVGAEPMEGHAIQGLKNMHESIIPDIYEPDRLDRLIKVEDRPAFAMTNRLAVEEGLFCGMSSGAAVAAACEVAAGLSPSDTVVTILCDRGDRYLSTSLFRSVCAECPP